MSLPSCLLLIRCARPASCGTRTVTVVVLVSLGECSPQIHKVIGADSSTSFESREACEEVIRTFNNHTIKAAGEELQIQIRYADTQEQKSLKLQTQAARQFRSAEYEFGESKQLQRQQFVICTRLTLGQQPRRGVRATLAWPEGPLMRLATPMSSSSIWVAQPSPSMLSVGLLVP